MCLSGGGYRAMLFHLGAAWRLYETGELANLDRISSVSGGSITAAVLGMNWRELKVSRPSRDRFEEFAVEPIRGLAGVTIDIGSALGGAFGRGTSAARLPKKYDRLLFDGRTLQDLPARPKLVINSTNVQSGALWRFSKSCMADWRVGRITRPKTPLAVAVAASSACPPFLSPLILRFKEKDYRRSSGYDLQKPPFTTRVVLTDGGVYDNLGLETAWKNHKRILVSNAGGQMAPQPRPSAHALPHLRRVFELTDNQVRSLRKRQLIGSYGKGIREGGYWGIRDNIADYRARRTLPCPHGKTMKLAQEPTRLKRLSRRRQKQLINWGYAICDAAIRKYAGTSAPPPEDFPYPGAAVG